MARRTWIRRIAAAVVIGAALAYVGGQPEVWTHVRSVEGSALWAVGALSMVGSGLVAISWAVLFPGSEASRSILDGYLLAQPGKYVPGGAVQTAMQLTSAKRAMGSWRATSVVFVGHTVALSAAGVLGALTVVSEVWESTSPFGVVALIAILGLVLVFWLFTRSHGRIGRYLDETRRFIVESPRRFGSSIVIALVALLAWGAGFAITLASISDAELMPSHIAIFVTGWLAGFLVFPVPAGLGIREVVMVALVPATGGAVVVVAASLVMRVAIAAAETVLAVAAFIRSEKRGHA